MVQKEKRLSHRHTTLEEDLNVLWKHCKNDPSNRILQSHIQPESIFDFVSRLIY